MMTGSQAANSSKGGATSQKRPELKNKPRYDKETGRGKKSFPRFGSGRVNFGTGGRTKEKRSIKIKVQGTCN